MTKAILCKVMQVTKRNLVEPKSDGFKFSLGSSPSWLPSTLPAVWDDRGKRRNKKLVPHPLPRPPSVLGSRESLATLSELDLGSERDVRVWPLHPSLLEEPHCFQVNAGNSSLFTSPRHFDSTLGLNRSWGSPSPTGNVGRWEPLLFLSLGR